MSDSTNRSLPDTKPKFYARADIANAYEQQRFGGASGAWVNKREIDLVLSLLPPFRRALDLGCGTGRLTRILAQSGTAIGMDTSNAMLRQAQTDNSSGLVQGDAFIIPCANASFDVVVALRLVFHFADLETLLREMARVIAPHGAIIFDTYVWSPRALLPLDKARWGERIFVHSPSLVEQVARQVNLNIVHREFCFLFSPYIYRRLPLPVVQTLARIEARLPSRLRTRVFWKLERTN